MSTPSAPQDTFPTDFDITFFIEHAKYFDLIRFIDAILQTSTGRNVQLLWSRAVAYGEKNGVKKGFREGYDLGYNAGTSIGYNMGYDDGALVAPDPPDQNPPETPNVPTEPVPTSPTPAPQVQPASSDQGVQTDTLRPVPVDSSSQASTFPTAATSDHLTEPPLLSWADDIPPLPDILIQEPLKAPAPRDLSCLRSTSINPFSSIRYRSKRSCGFKNSSDPPRQALYRHPFSRTRRVRQGPCKYAAERTNTRPWPAPPPGDLNWEKDPRLADLSRVLVSLGWVRC